MQKKHLDHAKARGAAILSLGDTLCLMSAKDDPRSSKGAIRHVYDVQNHFDAIIQDAASFFAPYADNIVMFAQGNHETNVLRRKEFCPTERLIGLTNAQSGSCILNGGYSGFVLFRFTYQKCVSGIKFHYHHGHSSGKSSANISAHERRAAFVPDADVIATGHAHNFWQDIVARFRVTGHGKNYQDEQLHLGCPSYKDDVGNGSKGWASESGFRPKKTGAWWLRFTFNRVLEKIVCEAIAAR